MNSVATMVREMTVIHDYDFTKRAQHGLETVVNSAHFRDRSPELILSYLVGKMYRVSFGDHLKRYIYERFKMNAPFSSLKADDFAKIILSSFEKNEAPFSFGPTKRKASVTVRKWLTQQSVRRSVVFLLGFGLGMDVRDVEMFLTKVIGERSFNMADHQEVIARYCYSNGLRYEESQKWLRYYESIDEQDMPDLSYVPSGIEDMKDESDFRDYLRYLRLRVRYEGKKQEAYLEFETLLSKVISQIARESDAPLPVPQKADESVQAAELNGADVSYRMVEERLYSGISFSNGGNLLGMQDSALRNAFQSYRLSRQRISRLMRHQLKVERYDLITLLFYLYAQDDPVVADPEQQKARCMHFVDEMNSILSRSGMIHLYPVNPYESFIMLCLLSPDPWESFCEVWYQSYQSEADPVF